jgi:hypothetical protein
MEAATIVRLIIVASFVALLFQRSVIDALVESIRNFRGGPPTPGHPLPANDNVILHRKRSRKS